MIVMLSVGETITHFSIFIAHVSAAGGNYTNLAEVRLLNINSYKKYISEETLQASI